MLGVVSVLQAVLIFGIAASLVFLATPIILSSVQESMDVSESSSVKQQLEFCNNKILETARTGTQNTCVFSTQSTLKGKVYLKQDGIYYELLSDAKVCDQTDWVNINPDKYIWLKCDLQDSKRFYQLRWSPPTEIIFILGDRQIGNNLEINRINVTANNTNLYLNFR